MLTISDAPWIMLYPHTSSREQGSSLAIRGSVGTFQSDSPLEIHLCCQTLSSRDSVTQHNSAMAGNYAKVNTSFLVLD